ncbi:GNAT family N-acetyltransferase [Spartinivicinus poritis]|uniref:GNAT family N-acetyltransferase n=1 Tax=Spartinivicinus poritis TaxID=2994640 RepID=A0ABT5UHR1_9GAMM|nr:GNAT family N-acetyltransferase [Spartinivicinus sp. A2-2]MDE1465906.1 GNAT family N-acetyltransferase [Spartinivicinus sp. A2-2]
MLGDKIIGTIGLHHYTWGPQENVWGGWLSIDPDYQRNGYSSVASKLLVDEARKLGYKRFFIEIYSGPEFEPAVAFYKKMGIPQSGKLQSVVVRPFEDRSYFLILFNML